MWRVAPLQLKDDLVAGEVCLPPQLAGGRLMGQLRVIQVPCSAPARPPTCLTHHTGVEVEEKTFLSLSGETDAGQGLLRGHRGSKEKKTLCFMREKKLGNISLRDHTGRKLGKKITFCL